MKKIINFLFLIGLFFCFITNVEAKEKITVYFFHGDGCPHCAAEEKFLDKLKNKYDFKVTDYEVWYDEENEEYMDMISEKYGILDKGVPLTIIGDSYFLGFNEDVIGSKIERCIKYYSENDYTDKVALIDAGEEVEINDQFKIYEEKTDKDVSVSVPILGKLNLKKLSISSAAVIIGLIDGFNPCAMWVLLFLISVLIGMKNRKRMWAIGFTFLFTSALVYMIIMFSWLNIVVKVSTSILIRNIIALVAIIGGVINLRSYLKSNKTGGCEVVDKNKRKKIFNYIKKFTSEKSFLLALLGSVVLAISVNIVELACSAGLPVVFTQLLAINNITGVSAFIYTLLYILFFLLDDLIIFIIAMATMNVTGISTKYNKYSHLIGGILMLVVGILLIVKPELLMFNI